MAERILIAEAPEHVGQKVHLKGWVTARRDHGKLIFLDLRDRSGTVQLIVAPQPVAAAAAAEMVRAEYAVSVEGQVNERPISAKKGVGTAALEIAVHELSVLAQPIGEFPLDVSQSEMNVNLDTLLDHRTAALRNEKVGGIFRIYSALLEGYALSCRAEDFLEIKTPKILSTATEGGANVFKVKYFDREAFLAQSPQFYKQAGASAFERVFEIGPVFRAEPHFTSRHVNEYIGLDGEMAFIDSVEEVMATLERIIFATLTNVETKGQVILDLYQAPPVARVPIPRIALRDALAILKNDFGKEVANEDIDAEGERMIGQYVKKEYGSDFVFLTQYPRALRAFYSMPTPAGDTTETFDLLFRGLEIASGAERIHEYDMLVESIRRRGLNPEDFASYLDIFRLGVPAHGGWGLGSERIIQQMLGLSSIKEAILYPRDVRRLEP